MTDEKVIEILQEIKDKIDTPNRGTCDYFIVDQIENIVKRELSKLKFSIELGKKSLVIPKEVFEQMKIQVETKDGEVVECDIDTSVLSKLKGENK